MWHLQNTKPETHGSEFSSCHKRHYQNHSKFDHETITEQHTSIEEFGLTEKQLQQKESCVHGRATKALCEK